MPSLVAFNANNFFLRYRFSNIYPGDNSRASLIDAAEVGAVGYLPQTAFRRLTNDYIIWDNQRRNLAAQALMAPERSERVRCRI